MAPDNVIKQDDTAPALEFILVESTTQDDAARYAISGKSGFWRRVDLKTTPPDSIRFICKSDSPAKTFSGDMINSEVEDDSSSTVGTVSGQDPGIGVPINRGMVRYELADGDSDTVFAEGEQEVEITWDSESTPPRVQTIPNKQANNPTLAVDPDLDPDT